MLIPSSCDRARCMTPGRPGRVAPGVTSWGSHRSVHAQLRHTAPLAADLHARRYLAGDGYSTRGSTSPTCCPLPVPRPTRRPLPSAGCPRTGLPASPVLGDAPTPCPPSRHTSFWFAWRYRPVRLFSSLRSGPPPAWGQELSGLAAPTPTLVETEWQGLPGSQGTLVDLCRVLRPRPDRPPLARNGAPVLPPCCPRRRLQRVVLSRLNSTASALAVYASSSPLRCRRRKTRFRWLARPCRAGLVTRRVPTKGF
jgi:hypothetical protein